MTEGLTLEIEMRPEGSEHDTALVTRYWALESVDQGRVVYREQPSALAGDVGMRVRTMTRRLGETALASSAILTCSTCSERLKLKSRRDLDAAVKAAHRGEPQFCLVCKQERTAHFEGVGPTVRERNRKRKEIAQQHFSSERLTGRVEDLVSGLPDDSLMFAVALVRAGASSFIDVCGLGDPGTVVRDLNRAGVLEVTNPLDLFVWVDDDPAADQVIDSWWPKLAQFKLDMDAEDILEAELVRREGALLTAPATTALAREILLDEFAGFVDYQMRRVSLPELSEIQFAEVVAMLRGHPDATSGQVIAAAWRAARDGRSYQSTTVGGAAATVRHVIGRTSDYLANRPDTYNVPQGYQWSPTTRVVFGDVLGRRPHDATLRSLPMPTLGTQQAWISVNWGRAWRAAILTAGQDPELSSRARGLVEEAAAVFTALVAEGVDAAVATQAAYHGLTYVQRHESEDDLRTARTILRQILDRHPA